MSHNISVGQIWSRLEEEYFPSVWTSDTKIWMKDGEGGDLSARKSILKYPNF